MGISPAMSPEALPSGSSVTFKSSSYFGRNGQNAVFPLPSEILERSAQQDPQWQDYQHKPPVRFEDLGLIVKFGHEPKVTIAEGQCLWAIRQALPEVPVPEIYGWLRHEEYIFLFMELVQGVTLEQRWAHLAQDERRGICRSLQNMLSQLRHLRQQPRDTFVGDVSRGPLGDFVFTNGNLPRAGPFGSVQEFQDWLSMMIKRGKGRHWPGIEESEIPDPYRKLLPDDSGIVFTHSDLHPSNILVSRDSPCQIMAIVDWQQSGWYPAYWEFCKAEYTAEPGSEWTTEYIPRFLVEPACVEGFELYSKAYGY